MKPIYKKTKSNYVKSSDDMVTTIRISRTLYAKAKKHNINISKVARDALFALLVEEYSA